MKAKLLATAILIISLGIGNEASAQVRQSARNQHQRIKQGVKSGEITRSEGRTIAKKERDVRQEVRQAKADGVVTASEKKDIRKEQRQASRTIYRKKHNRRDRN